MRPEALPYEQISLKYYGCFNKSLLLYITTTMSTPLNKACGQSRLPPALCIQGPVNTACVATRHRCRASTLHKRKINLYKQCSKVMCFRQRTVNISRPVPAMGEVAPSAEVRKPLPSCFTLVANLQVRRVVAGPTASRPGNVFSGSCDAPSAVDGHWNLCFSAAQHKVGIVRIRAIAFTSRLHLMNPLPTFCGSALTCFIRLSRCIALPVQLPNHPS